MADQSNPIDAWLCEECEELNQEASPFALYECDNCGEKFNSEVSGSHRCPECGKFARKVGDNSCIQCGTGPVDTVKAVWDGDKLVLAEIPKQPQVVVTAQQIEYMADLIHADLMWNMIPDWLKAVDQPNKHALLERIKTEPVDIEYSHNIRAGENERIFVFGGTTHSAVLVRREPTPERMLYNVPGELDQVVFCETVDAGITKADEIYIEERGKLSAALPKEK